MAFLEKQGYMDRLKPALLRQMGVRVSIAGILLDQYGLEEVFVASPNPRDVFEEDFFLILFSSICENSGSSPEMLYRYANLNFYIRGIVNALDNVLDDEAKTTLPLRKLGNGTTTAFEEARAYGVLLAVAAQGMSPAELSHIVRGWNDTAIPIRNLELREYAAKKSQTLDSIANPMDMIKNVHEVRGGRLFELGIVPPRVLEPGKSGYWAEVTAAFHYLGTAFQIVDDIVDFEFDLTRRSNNLVASYALKNGFGAGGIIRKYWGSENPGKKLVEQFFRGPAQAALQDAYTLAGKAFETLEQATPGFWYNPSHANQLVNAIAGAGGEDRVRTLVETS